MADIEAEYLKYFLDAFLEAGADAIAEFHAATEEFNDALRAASMAQRRYRQKNIVLRREVNSDELTGLLNRKGCDISLLQAFSGALRYNIDKKNNGERKQALAILFCDVDHFKSINDTYGHDIGDDVLKAVAIQITQEYKRISDVLARTRRDLDQRPTRKTGARHGGEEFVIALVHDAVAIEGIAVTMAEELCKAIKFNCKIWYDGLTYSVGPLGHEGSCQMRETTVSCGISIIQPEANHKSARAVNVDLAKRQADLAMFAAKQAGRDGVFIYGPSGPEPAIMATPLAPGRQQILGNPAPRA